jgi:hypothetical protein
MVRMPHRGDVAAARVNRIVHARREAGDREGIADRDLDAISTQSGR